MPTLIKNTSQDEITALYQNKYIKADTVIVGVNDGFEFGDTNSANIIADIKKVEEVRAEIDTTSMAEVVEDNRNIKVSVIVEKTETKTIFDIIRDKEKTFNLPRGRFKWKFKI